MEIRTILAGASGGSASGGALELACRLAGRFGAHLEAMHVRLDIAEVVMAAGAEGLAAAADLGWAEQTSGEVAAIAEATRVGFAAAVERNGLTLAEGAGGAAWHEETGDAATLVARRARFFDLVVLGRSDRVIDAPHTDAIEETLIRSGRPVLLAPAEAPGAIGESIAIAWNGSAEAVRAVAGALPLLRLAKKTVVVTLGAAEGEGADELQAYLALHGIAATQHLVAEVAGEGPGGQLLSAARDEGADLLVIGGYSHPPWREMLFGGATSEIVGASRLPVLVAH